MEKEVLDGTDIVELSGNLRMGEIEARTRLEAFGLNRRAANSSAGLDVY